LHSFGISPVRRSPLRRSRNPLDWDWGMGGLIVVAIVALIVIDAVR
jgi:hypothetical protein